VNFDSETDFSFNRIKKKKKICKKILEMIVNGKLELGEQLSIKKISEYFNASNTPVREALNNLEKDGLITKTPYSGFRVKVFSQKEIKDIFEVRIALESYAGKLCTERTTEIEKEKLKKILSKSEKYILQNNIEKYNQCNMQLHQKIVELSKNLYLLKNYKKIKNQITLFSSSLLYIKDRPKQSIKEHSEIVRNILLNKKNHVRDLIEEHIVNYLKDYKKYTNRISD